MGVYLLDASWISLVHLFVEIASRMWSRSLPTIQVLMSRSSSESIFEIHQECIEEQSEEGSEHLNGINSAGGNETDNLAILGTELNEIASLNGHGGKEGKKKRWNSGDHPVVPKQPKPPVGKLPDGTWGPTGLYGGRVKETKILAVLRSVVKPNRLKRVEEVLVGRSQRVQCLFENLTDPANGAACLRTMEGFGVLGAHAVESYEPFKVQGGITMNADKWMMVRKYGHCLDATTALKKEGFTIIATCLDDDAVNLTDVDYKSMDKICVMFGNEERGLSWALRNVADVKVYIPMSGFSQSFNISVSCAIVLFHLREQGVMVPDLDDETLSDLYLKWLLMSTKKSASLIKKHNLEKEVPDYV